MSVRDFLKSPEARRDVGPRELTPRGTPCLVCFNEQCRGGSIHGSASPSGMMVARESNLLYPGNTFKIFFKKIFFCFDISAHSPPSSHALKRPDKDIGVPLCCCLSCSSHFVCLVLLLPGPNPRPKVTRL